MDSSQALISLAWLLFPLLLIFFLSKKQTKNGVNLPPGPPRLPFIGNRHQLGKIPHQSLQKLAQKYGPVMLLKLGQIPVLVISSPAAAEQVMKTHDLECCSRPDSNGSNKLSYNASDIAFGPYTDYWREMRKVCMIELFTVKRVKSFSRVREAEVFRFIESVSKSCGSLVNLSEKVFELTNGFICKVAFGKNYDGHQFGGENLQDMFDEAMAMLSSFWASDFFPTAGWIWDMGTGQRKRLHRCFSKLDGFFESVIEEHLVAKKNGQNKEQEDIVNILLGLSMNQTTGFQFSRDQVKANLMNILIGAVDTSSLTMAWAMTELARNPRVMNKVQTEIRQIIEKKPKVDESEIEKLKYLQMVVKETFRLHPPATLLLP